MKCVLVCCGNDHTKLEKLHSHFRDWYDRIFRKIWEWKVQGHILREHITCILHINEGLTLEPCQGGSLCVHQLQKEKYRSLDPIFPVVMILATNQKLLFTEEAVNGPIYVVCVLLFSFQTQCMITRRIRRALPRPHDSLIWTLVLK